MIHRISISKFYSHWSVFHICDMISYTTELGKNIPILYFIELYYIDFSVLSYSSLNSIYDYINYYDKLDKKKSSEKVYIFLNRRDL